MLPESNFELGLFVLVIFFVMVKIILDLVKNRGHNDLVCSLKDETKQLSLLIQDLNSSMKIQNVLLDKIFQKVTE